jgi:hypothetical protein
MPQKFCHDVSRTRETPENANFPANPRFGMDVSPDDTGSRGRNYEDIEPHQRPQKQE